MKTAENYTYTTTIAEVFSELAGHSEFRFVAGGTDVMVNRFQGNSNEPLIDISGIDSLKQISQGDDYIMIGSGVTLHEISRNSLVCTHFPVLATAAKQVATPVIRKTATLGGNLLCENRCVFYNQSEWWRESAGNCLKCGGIICLATQAAKNCYARFVSDMAVVLISLNASIEVEQDNGPAFLSLESIYSGDGLKPVNLVRGSLLKTIIIPQNPNAKTVFKKLRQRETMDFSSLSVAVNSSPDAGITLALGSAHARPVVCRFKEINTAAEATEAIMSQTRIVNNDVYPRDYRRQMVSVLIAQCYKELALNTEIK